MSDDLLRRRSLDSLKKEAKRWLDALRRHGAERAGALALARYESAAAALLEAYRTGTPDAMDAHYRHTWHRRPWPAMRTYVQLDLGKRLTESGDDIDITLDDARYLVATEHGFAAWSELKAFTESAQPGPRVADKPVRLAGRDAGELARSREWDAIIAALASHPSARLVAEGQMTDDILADVARLENVTALDLGGSRALTDDGLGHIAGMPHLEHLDLSGTAITDRGLGVLHGLPALRSLSLAMTRVTDAGAAELAHCHDLESVDLSGTRTGDGAIRALGGKRGLRRLRTGILVTDAGMPLLHELPVFKTWHGGQAKMELVGHRSEPNHLSLRGSFTDRGMQHLRGLDGLYGLDLGDANLAITAAALVPLVSLPNLGHLDVDARDDWMPIIAEMPHLCFLGAQDTTAGDDGFVALSASGSIEYIWGRRCHNLGRRGFVALANMPALRGLSVSCLNVDDAGIAALPAFPALRELMPMDVPDAGYRHIGKCERLESLVLMYCRDTTDAATDHITGLSHLSYYFNSYTMISDRTPELLSQMASLERVTFDACHNLTNAGVSRLARLPRLRELRVAGRQITGDVAAAFPATVSVSWGR